MKTVATGAKLAVTSAVKGEAGAAAAGAGRAALLTTGTIAAAMPFVESDNPKLKADIDAQNAALVKSGRRVEHKHLFGLITTYEDVPAKPPSAPAAGLHRTATSLAAPGGHSDARAHRDEQTTEAIAERLARAVADAMKTGMKVMIMNASDSPIVATTAAGVSAAAGSQAH